MKFAVSNIGLSAYDHYGELARLPEMGFEGLEVALSRVWRDDWNSPSPQMVATYRSKAEAAGLKIVGLHSLFWKRAELTIFGDADIRARTLDFLEQLSRVCRDLGGRTLIYGSRTARWRGSRSMDQANDQATSFFDELCRRIEGHGTCYCLEPLETEVADYINSVRDSLAVVEAVNHPALRVQIDAKALVANHEAKPETFEAAKKYLVHYHANQSDLGVLSMNGAVDHAALGLMLDDIGYGGYVSIEQRMLNEDAPLDDISKSAAVLRQCYK